MKNATRPTALALASSGLFYSILLIIMAIYINMFPVEGSLESQILALRASSLPYKVNFAIAFLLAPLLSFLMVTLLTGVPAKKNMPIVSQFSMLFLGGYLLLVSIAYSSQFVVFPSLLETKDLANTHLWYFNLETSLPYFIDQLGYVFFSIAAVFTGYKLFSSSGLLTAAGVFLWLSAAFQFLAFIGLIIGHNLLISATFLSGLMTLPVGIIAAIQGFVWLHDLGQH